MLGSVCSFDETFAIRLAPKDVLHVKARVPRTPVMIQLDLKLRILRASECCRVFWDPGAGCLCDEVSSFLR